MDFKKYNNHFSHQCPITKETHFKKYYKSRYKVIRQRREACHNNWS